MTSLWPSGSQRNREATLNHPSNRILTFPMVQLNIKSSIKYLKYYNLTDSWFQSFPRGESCLLNVIEILKSILKPLKLSNQEVLGFERSCWKLFPSNLYTLADQTFENQNFKIIWVWISLLVKQPKFVNKVWTNFIGGKWREISHTASRDEFKKGLRQACCFEI